MKRNREIKIVASALLSLEAIVAWMISQVSLGRLFSKYQACVLTSTQTPVTVQEDSQKIKLKITQKMETWQEVCNMFLKDKKLLILSKKMIHVNCKDAKTKWVVTNE